MCPGKKVHHHLKDGEEEFLSQARLVKRFGAAVVIMVMDEIVQVRTVQGMWYI